MAKITDETREEFNTKQKEYKDEIDASFLKEKNIQDILIRE